MADETRHRIGARHLHIGGGAAPTVADIENLTERQRQQEKQLEAEPERPFSDYLAQGEGEGAPDDNGDEAAAKAENPDAGAPRPPAASARPARTLVPVPRGRHIIKG